MSEHRHIVDSAAQSLDALSRHVDGLKEEHARLLRELSKYQAIDTEEGREAEENSLGKGVQEHLRGYADLQCF